MGFKGSKVQILSSRPEGRKPQGIYGNVDPFSVLGSAIFFFSLSDDLTYRSVREGGPHGTNLPRRSPDHRGMVSASANLVGSRQSIDHKQKATKVSSVAFFICAKNPGPANSCPAFRNLLFSPRCPGTKNSRGGPRVPFRLPNGKGVYGNNALRPRPAF